MHCILEEKEIETPLYSRPPPPPTPQNFQIVDPPVPMMEIF